MHPLSHPEDQPSKLKGHAGASSWQDKLHTRAVTLQSVIRASERAQRRSGISLVGSVSPAGGALSGKACEVPVQKLEQDVGAIAGEEHSPAFPFRAVGFRRKLRRAGS